MFRKFLLCLVALTVVSSPAFADKDPQVIYIALSEVSMSNGKGTSEQLNQLVHHYGSRTGGLQNTLARNYGLSKPMEVHVYNKDNMRFLHDNCDYVSDALGCGVQNNHWTLRTFVYVGDKYSSITVKLYDEKGREISKGEKTAWGTIRLIPQWKYTKIKQKGGFAGNSETEILEVYPPKIEELPPLLAPYHVWQATALMYASVRTKK